MGRKNKNKRMKKKTALANISTNGSTDAATTTAKPSTIPRSIEDTPEPTQQQQPVVVESPPPASQTRSVLTQGRKDLKNAQPPLGFLFEPLRKVVLDPSMALATIVVPGVVTAVPALDSLTATSIQIPFSVIKFGYGLLPFRSDAKEIDLALVAQNDLLAVSAAGSSPLPPLLAPDSLRQLIRVATAFGFSVAVDVLSALLNPGKAATWLVSLWQFFRFLDSSRLDNDLQQAVVKPLYGGRLIDNINIYRKIFPDPSFHKVKRFRRSQVQQQINDGSRFMKYATAAYGTGMIQASLESSDNVSAKQLETVKSAIAKHVGIKKSDIREMCVTEGGNVKLLRHFVAVDRKSHNVVLAIRGTLSVSGALIDLQADDADFCTGMAHRGMAEMATNLWSSVGGAILKLLAQLDATNDNTSAPWGLVLTGHSLGAGTAALLNIKCHVENLLGNSNRPIKCFAFACPPVFYLPEEETRDSVAAHGIDKAIKNCTSFIQGEDCVPFLSVSTVAKCASQLEIVDDTSKSMNPFERMALASGKKNLPENLINDVQQAPQPPVLGASRLIIPAEKIVWTYSIFGGGYDVIGCLADELVNLSIFMSGTMMTDHFPADYEDSLDALAK